MTKTQNFTERKSVAKKKYSNAGKGDKSRVSNKKKFDENWDKIFKQKESNNARSSNQKSVTII